MKECCETCRLKLRLEKLDYSNGGCAHTLIDGYICLAFRDDGIACWLVGQPSETGMCECYAPLDEPFELGKLREYIGLPPEEVKKE